MGARVFLEAACLVMAASIQNPEEFPHLLTGAYTEGQKFSTGNTLPLVGRPWGFNHFCPQTSDGKTSWWFNGASHQFRWLRITHQPSPWIGDWGWVVFGPQMGGRVDDPVMFWNPWGARFKPHVFDATLGPDNMRIQLTPTEHGAVLKVTFPRYNPANHAKRICFRLPPPDKGHKPGRMEATNDEDMWLEMTSSRANEVPGNFGLKLRAQVDTKSLKSLHKVPKYMRISKSAVMNCFEFNPDETAVTVWIGTSLISSEMALLSLNREAANRPYEDVEEESRQVWSELLGRVEVADPGPMTAEVFQRLTKFYTGLYRALSFPRRIDELDQKFKRVHYSPYDKQGGTYDGVLVTDNGFWDTFRTVYPLLNLVYPTEAGEIVQGWLNAYKEGGWLPEWSSPGYRSCMVGTFADVVVADAVMKDLQGFDRELAWQAIRKDSYEPGGRKGQGGKLHYNEYNSFGYVPAENPDSVSGTLDFAYSDFAASLAAGKLGKKHDAETLQRRAIKARQHLYDPTSGLMRPKGRGGFLSHNAPHQWGTGYTEGSAWHHSFPAFDLLGLATLHGSRDKLARKIQELVETPGTFVPGSYKQIIHEMEEMRALGMGQYAHNNQPVHHVLFLLSGLDESEPTCTEAAAQEQSKASGAFCPRLISESMVHDVLERGYGLEFYSGDEDNGEMGAWYVLAALGLFEPAPGTNHGYSLGSPLFRHVNLYRSKRDSPQDSTPPSLSIISHKSGTKEVRHVTRVTLNGKDVGHAATDQRAGWTITFEELFKGPTGGGTLRFLTGAEQASDAAPPAPPMGAPVEGASSPGDGVLERLQHQLQVQQEQRAHGQQASKSFNVLASGPERKPEAQVKVEERSQVRQQQTQIEILENQLKKQAEESRLAQSKAASEADAGLTSTVFIAFGILVAVNAVGWFLCIGNRGGKKARGRPARVGRSYRGKEQGLDV